MTDLT